MRPPLRARQHGLKVNLTPLIDIVFLLIIFFLAASHLAQSETAQAVELPEASPQEDEEQLPKRMVITITSTEQLFVAGNEISLPQLEALILRAKEDAGDEPIEVQIRSDRQVPYRVVEPVLLACVQAGITKVNFAIHPVN